MNGNSVWMTLQPSQTDLNLVSLIRNVELEILVPRLQCDSFLRRAFDGGSPISVRVHQIFLNVLRNERF